MDNGDFDTFFCLLNLDTSNLFNSYTTYLSSLSSSELLELLKSFSQKDPFPSTLVAPCLKLIIRTFSKYSQESSFSSVIDTLSKCSTSKEVKKYLELIKIIYSN
mmetsp:Transcript_13541/g.20489  ORF Transcript_13541/g.20489 Transcript_13541/m.20489 type:complete len:104 (-) Transcript_13541:45-356(-)